MFQYDHHYSKTMIVYYCYCPPLLLSWWHHNPGVARVTAVSGWLCCGSLYRWRLGSVALWSRQRGWLVIDPWIYEPPTNLQEVASDVSWNLRGLLWFADDIDPDWATKFEPAWVVTVVHVLWRYASRSHPKSLCLLYRGITRKLGRLAKSCVVSFARRVLWICPKVRLPNFDQPVHGGELNMSKDMLTTKSCYNEYLLIWSI